jgi:hypothetical protein
MWRVLVFLLLCGTACAGEIVQWQDFPPPPEGNDFVAIAQGENHALALRSNGCVECWAKSGFEYICDRIPDGNYFAIAATHNESAAVRLDGSICRGPAGRPEGNDYMAVAIGSSHAVALKTDGSLVSWGENYQEQVSDTPSGDGFVEIVARDFYSMALRDDGQVFEWGERFFSQVPYDLNEPSPYVTIAAGHNRRYAIREDGKVYSWGNLWHAPNPPDGNYIAIASGDFWTVAIRTNGSLVASGDFPFDANALPDGNNFVAVSAYGQYGMALRSSETATLTVATEPNDMNGISPLAGTYEYYRGKPVCLNARRSPRCPAVYAFNYWSGDISDPCQQAQFVFLDANYTVMAHYTIDEKECGDECHPIYEAYDTNRDCKVNFVDFAALAERWGCTHPDCD